VKNWKKEKEKISTPPCQTWGAFMERRKKEKRNGRRLEREKRRRRDEEAAKDFVLVKKGVCTPLGGGVVERSKNLSPAEKKRWKKCKRGGGLHSLTRGTWGEKGTRFASRFAQRISAKRGSRKKRCRGGCGKKAGKLMVVGHGRARVVGFHDFQMQKKKPTAGGTFHGPAGREGKKVAKRAGGGGGMMLQPPNWGRKARPPCSRGKKKKAQGKEPVWKKSSPPSRDDWEQGENNMATCGKPGEVSCGRGPGKTNKKKKNKKREAQKVIRTGATWEETSGEKKKEDVLKQESFHTSQHPKL